MYRKNDLFVGLSLWLQKTPEMSSELVPLPVFNLREQNRWHAVGVALKVTAVQTVKECQDDLISAPLTTSVNRQAIGIN